MSTPKRVTPWRTLSIAQGNAIQLGGLLGAAVLAWYAGREGARGTRWIVVSRLLAYFSEHAFSHWLVGRILGIHFTGYGLHGTSHPQFYPPGVRWVFSHLPLLSARADPTSLRAAAPTARATMYAAGTGGTMLVGLTIPLYAWLRGISGARGLLISSAGVTNAALLLSESLRPGGDLRRAWWALRESAN
ncbi:MAG: hypothetical protein M3305_08585 [Actinomycetota bacterium]|nr:hypothetical protein [Actinomycetota bacterium]